MPDCLFNSTRVVPTLEYAILEVGCRSAPEESYLRRTLMVVAVGVIVLLFLAAGGCGSVGSLSGGSAHQMLVQDGTEVKAYLAKAQDILTSKAASIEQRKQRFDALGKQYEVFWPGAMEPQVKPAEWNKVIAASKGTGKKTIYGTLYGLAEKKPVVVNGKQYDARSVPEYLSRAAGKYYVAVDNLNSLRYFDDMLAGHTVGDGTKVNRGNPPAKTATGLGAFGGAFIGIDWDQATGDLKLFRYNTDPQFDTSGSPTTVSALEQSFIDSARARIAEADAMVQGKSAP